jgi:hypothetical protein
MSVSNCAHHRVVHVHVAPVIQEHPLVLRRVVSLVGEILLEPRGTWEQHRSSIYRIECLVNLNPLRVRLLQL